MSATYVHTCQRTCNLYAHVASQARFKHQPSTPARLDTTTWVVSLSSSSQLAEPPADPGPCREQLPATCPSPSVLPPAAAAAAAGIDAAAADCVALWGDCMTYTSWVRPGARLSCHLRACKRACRTVVCKAHEQAVNL